LAWCSLNFSSKRNEFGYIGYGCYLLKNFKDLQIFSLILKLMYLLNLCDNYEVKYKIRLDRKCVKKSLGFKYISKNYATNIIKYPFYSYRKI